MNKIRMMNLLAFLLFSYGIWSTSRIWFKGLQTMDWVQSYTQAAIAFSGVIALMAFALIGLIAVIVYQWDKYFHRINASKK